MFSVVSSLFLVFVLKVVGLKVFVLNVFEVVVVVGFCCWIYCCTCCCYCCWRIGCCCVSVCCYCCCSCFGFCVCCLGWYGHGWCCWQGFFFHAVGVKCFVPKVVLLRFLLSTCLSLKVGVIVEFFVLGFLLASLLFCVHFGLWYSP